MPVEALRIDDDDLSFDLLSDIERGFAVLLSDVDVAKVSTAGQLHALIVAAARYTGGRACPTAMTFYELRRSLASLGLAPDARPSQPLPKAGLGSPKAIRRHLESDTGLELPPLGFGWVGWLGLFLFPLSVAVGWWWSNIWGLVCVACAGAALLKLDGAQFSRAWATLDSLTRAVAARNHAALAGRGARHSPRTIWIALTQMLSEWGTPASEIGPDTRLLK